MHIPKDIGFLPIATALFFVINSIGQIPLFLGMLSRFEHKRQMQIIIREMSIALCILLAFTFFGDNILDVLGISRPVISVAGGILLFLISLPMIFPPQTETKEKSLTHEPMIVPLAIPILAGPGTISTVMLYSQKTGNELLVAAALLTAWALSLVVLLLGSYIKGILGDKGLTAVERLGGMLVCLIGTKMLINGIFDSVKDFF